MQQSDESLLNNDTQPNNDSQLDDSQLEEEEEIDYEELERRLDEEAQQELYKSIINKTSKLDLDSLMAKRKPDTSNRITRHKPSKFMSLSQLNSKMDEAAPKKFTSKRADEKRKQLGIDEKPQYRKFNARKQPYNFVNKQKTQQVAPMNNSEFPSLG